MPRMDGMELLRRVPSAVRHCGHFLDSKDEEIDNCSAEVGADRLHCKSRSRSVSVERVKAVLRRARPPAGTATTDDGARSLERASFASIRSGTRATDGGP
jgi:DNA-binding response OmpR family regulator